MKLNCKQGDLAVIVRSQAGNEGKVVQCLRLVLNEYHAFPGPRWLIDRPVPHSTQGTALTVADCALRPLRDGEGEDEMLRLVGLPNVDAPQAA
jgi:hypothetical protein